MVRLLSHKASVNPAPQVGDSGGLPNVVAAPKLFNWLI